MHKKEPKTSIDKKIKRYYNKNVKNKEMLYAPLAQLVEQVTLNRLPYKI